MTTIVVNFITIKCIKKISVIPGHLDVNYRGVAIFYDNEFRLPKATVGINAWFHETLLKIIVIYLVQVVDYVVVAPDPPTVSPRALLHNVICSFSEGAPVPA